MNRSILPEIIALLNGISFFLLISGFIAIKNKRENVHRICMSLALVSSTFFLGVYLWHHYQVGSIPYPHYDWTRNLYFIILVPHILLAAGMLPLVFLAFRYALLQNWDKHKKVAKILYPIWTYVSFTGLIVYWMLYRL